MADEIQTIPEILEYRSVHDKLKEVFFFYDKNGLVCKLTPSEIYSLSGRFAYCLREWGCQQGDVIANGLPNSPERVVSDFGIIMAGCVLANFQVVEKDGSDFWNTANVSQCKYVLVANRKGNAGYKLISPFLPENTSLPGIYDMSIQQAPSIRKVLLLDRKSQHDTAYNPEHSLMDMLRNQDDMKTFQAKCSPCSLALLFGTSGSTGFSKLIPKSHAIILDSGRKFRVSESNLYFTDRPVGWMGGFPFEFLGFAGQRVLQDKFDNQEADDALGLWRILETAKCTGAAMVPIQVSELLDCFKDNPPQYKLQFITAGGQAMKKELMNAIGVLCKAVVVSYGSTEGGMFTSDLITDAGQFEDFYAGKAMPGVTLKIVDEEGNEVERGQEGQIYIKCDRITKRYYKSPHATSSSISSSLSTEPSSNSPSSSAISSPSPSLPAVTSPGDDDNTLSSDLYTPDGWFKSGDRGALYEDNRLFCHGRMGDVITVGPILVYLSWPESILNKCPNVQNSSIIGIDAHNDGKSKLYACVVPKNGIDNLSESNVVDFFNKAMMKTDDTFRLNLSRVFFMDYLPVLPTGKIHKRELKQYVVEQLKTSQSQ